MYCSMYVYVIVYRIALRKTKTQTSRVQKSIENFVFRPKRLNINHRRHEHRPPEMGGS